ncbi:MAG TPA: methylmalonyl-CoA mutase family protein, partial [Terriglobales bacterium]|nr:methylmalonyl-CoA mutase family protein [Terriglobales bacterium]
MAENAKSGSGVEQESTRGAETPTLPQNRETSSHIGVHPLYTPADLAGFDQEHEVGYPGQYPFTRGVQPTMYRG